MIAYLKVLALRWTRSQLGLEVLVGAFGAPLFFTGAVYFLFTFGPYATASSEDSKHMFEGLFMGVIMLSLLSAALSFTYLLTRTLHTEKLHNRVTILRTSGLDGVQAVLCFLAVGVIMGMLVVPLSLVGAHILHLIIGTPAITFSLTFISIAMVIALSPIVIGVRLYFEQPVAITLACGAAVFGTGYIIGIAEAGPIEDPFAYLIRIGAVWLLGASVLLLMVSLHSRAKRRKGWT